LPVVLYGCEAWSLALSEEHRPRVFENRILRRIFRPMRNENGEWRRFHSEEIYSLYRSPNLVRVINSKRLRWAGQVARIEEGRSALKILTGTPAGKRPVERPRGRWEDNIRIDLKETCINTRNWVDSAHDRDYWRAFVNAALNLWVLQAVELVISFINVCCRIRLI